MELTELHKKDPVIRTGPNMLSYGDVRAVKDIYDHSTKCTKDSSYAVTAGTHFNLADVVDKTDHARKRKVLSSAYGLKNLESWEFKITDKVQRMFKHFDDVCTVAPKESVAYKIICFEEFSFSSFSEHRSVSPCLIISQISSTLRALTSTIPESQTISLNTMASFAPFSKWTISPELVEELSKYATPTGMADYAALAVIAGTSATYLSRGILWDQPDPYRHLAFERPQLKHGGQAGVNANKETRNIAQKLEETGKNIVVFWGSQSGTAEGFAHRLAREISIRWGQESMTADLSDYDPVTITEIPSTKLAISSCPPTVRETPATTW